MSKVAAYLQEHILGEVTTNPATLEAMSTDTSVLKIMPEMVIYPRVTNDIRKVARFAWQLAEKGHIMPITARGTGTDKTGGAIGKGVILSLPAHMNKIFEFEPKQKLVRVQPGLSSSALNGALQLHGVAIPTLPAHGVYGTIGGAVGKNASGHMSARYGSTASWIHQLEVVLANGDVLQTGRLSKRELNRKKGQQNFEGEIYRTIDGLIEDNKQLIIEKLMSDIRDNAGYMAIADVKHRDGSFDLTPLIAGSQGTLGIISEMIMKTDFVSMKSGVAVAAFSSRETARDAIDQIKTLNPASLEYFDGQLFTHAAEQGKTYEVCKDIVGSVGVVVVAVFDDFSERIRAKKLKKITKLLAAVDATVKVADGDEAEELLAVREVTAFAGNQSAKDISVPPLFDGAYVAPERFEDFATAVAALAEKYHVSLPLYGNALESVYSARPLLELHKISDKQKTFKLLDEYTSLVDHHSGHLIGEDGEGRVKARFAYKQLDDEILTLFAAVKSAFDPHGILNPGVKQEDDLKQLVTRLRSGYDNAAFADAVLYD